MGAEAPNPTAQTKVQVEAVQTVTPWKSSGPRRPRRITASPAALAEAMQSRVCMVLAYKRPVEDTMGWNLAGKLKESLNVALSEQPVIAGRLRRADAGDGGVEVKFTDSGVRLVQARACVAMEEFLESDGAARELAFWGDVEEKSLQYSPLFFVQLTIFEGEGYSIGVSGSLLLTDPLLTAAFIKTWSKIHSGMRFSESSIFHLSKFRRPTGAPVHLYPLHHCHHRTLFFTSTSTDPNPHPSHLLGQPFTLFVNDPSGDLKIESLQAMPRDSPPTSCKWKDVNWVEHVGIDKAGFEEQLRPAHVFCFLESYAVKGLVVVMPTGNHSPGSVTVGVTVPEM